MLDPPQLIRVVDSHTEGEPTRVVIDGFPSLGSGTVAEQRELFRSDFDHLRRAIVCEPRGSEVLVGALLVPPRSTRAVTGVIFFNPVGTLHACGHGTMGVAATLAHLGRIEAGLHWIETPVGEVSVHVEQGGGVTIENVASRRVRRAVAIEVPGFGQVVGDVAWGGNWFFLVQEHRFRLRLEHVPELLDFTTRVRRALADQGITGDDGNEIDHVELFGPSARDDCDSRNFVLCPGGAYDRSPCGTGTSAKMACLFEDGALAEGETWRQESIIGSRFVGSIRREGDRLIPRLRGTAFVTAEATLVLDQRDPYVWGAGTEARRHGGTEGQWDEGTGGRT